MNNRQSLQVSAVIGLVLCLTTGCVQKSPWDESMAAGHAAFKVGHYSEAEKSFTQACREAEKSSDDGRLAASLNELAETQLKEKNRYMEAESVSKRALALSEKTSKPNQSDLAESLNTLSNVYLSQLAHGYDDGHLFDFDQKRKELDILLNRAVAIGEKKGSDQVAFAESLIAEAKRDASHVKEKEAKTLLEQALAIKEKALGPEHPAVAETLRDLADLETKLADTSAPIETRTKDLKQIADLYHRALKIQENTLGEYHPEVAKTLDSVGWIHQEGKELKRAEENFKRAISIDEKNKANGSPESDGMLHLISLYNVYDQNALTKPFSIGDFKYVPEVYKDSPKGFELKRDGKTIVERKLVHEYPYEYANISLVFPLANARLTKDLNLESRWGETCKLTGDRLTRLPVINNLTGGTDPSVIVGSFSGGMNSCCTDYEIFSLGKKVTNLPGLEGRNVYEFTFGDFHGDGQLYAIGQDMTWAYWNASMADSTLPGVVLHYTPKGWKLSLDDMKVESISQENIKKALTKCIESRKASEKEYPPAEDVFSLNGDVWTVMLNMIYAGHASDAWSFLDQVWPKDKSLCSQTTEDGHYMNRDAFKNSIKDQLRKSPYWNDLLLLNQGQEL